VVTVSSTKKHEARNYGRVVRDRDHRIMQIVEDKDATPEQKQIREINTAIYCFQWPTVKEGLVNLTNENQQREYYLTDIVSWAYDSGLKTTAVIAQDWREAAGI